MAQNTPESNLRGRTGGIYCGKRGNDYQIYVTMYILLRAFNTYSSQQSFELRMERPEAGEFDDIWLKVGNKQQLFVQVKYYTSCSCVTRGMLLPRITQEKGPFSLYKFSQSFEATRKRSPKPRNQEWSHLLLTNLPLSDRTLDLFEEGDSKRMILNVMKIGRYFKLRNTAEMKAALKVSNSFFQDFTLSVESLSLHELRSAIKDEIKRFVQEDPRIVFAELEQELSDWVCNKDTRRGRIDRKWFEHFFRKLQNHKETVIQQPQMEVEIENGQLPTLQVFTLRQILEKCRKFQFNTHHLLVDFVLYGKQSDIKTKYRMLQEVLKRVGLNMASTIFTQQCQVICFPDRVNIIGRTLQIVAEQYCKLKDEAERVGLKVNTSETRYLLAGGTFPGSHVIIDGDKIKVVREFVYHESLITADNNCSNEINRCISTGAEMLKNIQHSLKANKTLYKQQILQQMLRGCETWTIIEKDLQALAVFERQVLRAIFPNKRHTNTQLVALYNEPTIERVVKARRAHWAGQIARMPDSDPVKIVLFSDPPSCSKRSGGQPASWLDQVERDLQGVKRGGNWRYAARDETRWRGIVDEIRSAK